MHIWSLVTVNLGIEEDLSLWCHVNTMCKIVTKSLSTIFVIKYIDWFCVEIYQKYFFKKYIIGGLGSGTLLESKARCDLTLTHIHEITSNKNGKVWLHMSYMVNLQFRISTGWLLAESGPWTISHQH